MVKMYVPHYDTIDDPSGEIKHNRGAAYRHREHADAALKLAGRIYTQAIDRCFISAPADVRKHYKDMFYDSCFIEEAEVGEYERYGIDI